VDGDILGLPNAMHHLREGKCASGGQQRWVSIAIKSTSKVHQTKMDDFTTQAVGFAVIALLVHNTTPRLI
jgi:hypothetical protein